MKLLIIFLGMLALDVQAVPVQRLFQDAKLPTQQMIEKQEVLNAVVSSQVRLSSSVAGPTTGNTTVVSSFALQPDVPRNLTIIPGATTAHVGNCVVTVAGTDYLNKALSENFTFLAGASTVQTGLHAFKTVVSATFPAGCETTPFDATWSIGVGEKIGLKRCMAESGDVLFSLLNGAKEATLPTVTAHASDVSLNTADFVGTMDGNNDFIVYFIQNFGCFN